MKRHKVHVRIGRKGLAGLVSVPLVRRSVRAALEMEGVDVPCEVGVLVTDDEGILELNRNFRGVDLPTDVLSFPMQDLVPGKFEPDLSEIDPETGLLPLGDIALSWERVEKQAEMYGHTPEKEMAYLLVHSALHLLGYDHTDEGPQKRKMREREDAILREMGFAL